jgi:hypothetical protein
MKHTICQGLQARLWLLSPQLLTVLMAVMTQVPLPQSPESCPALWQEEKQCINSAPEWVCKLTFNNCVCACTVPDLPVADQKMLLNYCIVFIKFF